MDITTTNPPLMLGLVLGHCRRSVGLVLLTCPNTSEEHQIIVKLKVEVMYGASRCDETC